MLGRIGQRVDEALELVGKMSRDRDRSGLGFDRNEIQATGIYMRRTAIMATMTHMGIMMNGAMMMSGNPVSVVVAPVAGLCGGGDEQQESGEKGADHAVAGAGMAGSAQTA